MTELNTLIPRTIIDSAASGPDDSGNYNPANPYRPSRVPERHFDLPEEASASLDAFFDEIDYRRVPISNSELRKRAKNRPWDIIGKVGGILAEIGVPVAAGVIAENILTRTNLAGPIVATTVGAVTGAATGVMKTRNMNAETGEG